MERADVVVVGGGPAGSSCATRLVVGGADVIVIDRARFPRDKPCAGWITPEAVAAARLDPAAYAAEHTLQPIHRFRVGWAFGPGREVRYDTVVSYGIRRCELDNYLLRRSGARLRLAEGVVRLRRARDRWLLNEDVEAPLLVGAGGHFCPVARALRGPSRGGGGTVVAQEMEIRLTPAQAALCAVAPERPELDFLRDLSGYGWCFRKGDYLNIGLGQRDAQALASAVRVYLGWLADSGRIPAGLPSPLRGHAYRLREGTPGPIVGPGVLLVGDAAGLAYAASGEGIYPAIVSGQIAAELLLEGRGANIPQLAGYSERLAARLGAPAAGPALPGPLRVMAGQALLGSPWLIRRVVLDRWFLHRRGQPRPPSPS